MEWPSIMLIETYVESVLETVWQELLLMFSLAYLVCLLCTVGFKTCAHFLLRIFCFSGVFWKWMRVSEFLVTYTRNVILVLKNGAFTLSYVVQSRNKKPKAIDFYFILLLF